MTICVLSLVNSNVLQETEEFKIFKLICNLVHFTLQEQIRVHHLNWLFGKYRHCFLLFNKRHDLLSHSWIRVSASEKKLWCFLGLCCMGEDDCTMSVCISGHENM